MPTVLSTIAGKAATMGQNVANLQLVSKMHVLAKTHAFELYPSQLCVTAAISFSFFLVAAVAFCAKSHKQLLQSLKSLGARAGQSVINMQRHHFAVADDCNHSFFFALAPDPQVVTGNTGAAAKDYDEEHGQSTPNLDTQCLAKSCSQFSVVELTFGTDLHDSSIGSSGTRPAARANNAEHHRRQESPFNFPLSSPSTIIPSSPPLSLLPLENVLNPPFGDSSSGDVFLSAYSKANSRQWPPAQAPLHMENSPPKKRIDDMFVSSCNYAQPIPSDAYYYSNTVANVNSFSKNIWSTSGRDNAGPRKYFPLYPTSSSQRMPNLVCYSARDDYIYRIEGPFDVSEV